MPFLLGIYEVFFLNYYTPKKIYDDRCYIYNFWPHDGESIVQAWGRLKELIRKNPWHDFTKNIILINFYVRLPQHQKYFRDHSYGGSFNNKKEEESWDLLDIISKNVDNWGFDKGNTPHLKYEYSCAKNFSTSIIFEELSNRFGFDPYVLVKVTKI
jgi:hypothetical protein